MRFNKLDLNLLVALNALLLDASISRAAERLHMSQSAMSSALGRLRDYFGDQLLVQVGRRMELTPRAEVLREAVRDVLVRVDSTIAAQPEFTPATSDREFRILVSDYTLTTLAPHLLALAHESSKTLRFRFLPQVDQPLRVIEQNEADMLVFPRVYCSDEHPIEPLWEEEFVCLVCSHSALAGTPLTFERFVASGHVVMQPPNTEPSFESWFLKRHGVSRRVEVSTYSFASVPPLLVNTERIATVHSRLAKIACQSMALTALPPPMAMPKMEQSIQWHKYRTQDPALIWLRNLMHRAAERMDQTLKVAASPAPDGL
ncbi:MAG: LysR family transcriptional regulator [Pseudomonadota bacterium]